VLFGKLFHTRLHFYWERFILSSFVYELFLRLEVSKEPIKTNFTLLNHTYIGHVLSPRKYKSAE